MALTASSLTDSLPSMPALPSAAALAASSRAALKDINVPKLDRERLDAIPRALPRDLPFGPRRRGRRPLRRLAERRPWRKPTFTEQLIEVTAQLVAPGPDDPAPLTVVRDTVSDLSGSVGDAGATWRRALSPRAEGSHASLWSAHSSYSALSTHSLASFGSALSMLSAGSILSIGSTGSILSIGSVGSVLSIGSVGSVLSIGAAGRNGLAPSGDLGLGASAAPNAALLGSATRVVRLSAGMLGACAIVATAARS